MSTSRHDRRRRAALAVTAAFLMAMIPVLPVAANNAVQSLPFSQQWTDATQITANDDWSNVPGIVGFLGQDITTVTGTDPQTLVADSAVANDVDVIANQTNTAITNGGVAEFDIGDDVVALQGSGTADAPHLVLNLDTTGLESIKVAYTLRDIDFSADNAIQPVALQYRVGSSGDWTNVAAGFVADATSGPSVATLVTPVSATLPAAAGDNPLLQVRIITTNAAGSDEWVGVDDIAVTGTQTPTDDGPTVTSATPANGASDVALDANISVTFSEPVDVAGNWFSIDCTASSNHFASATGGPTTWTIDPINNFRNNETCRLTIVGEDVNDQDAEDPPDFMAGDFTATFTTPVVATLGDIVISEVYGGGGNSGATLKNDFIELRNRTTKDLSLAGWTVQYASATGLTWQTTTLSGTIPAGRNYLIKEAAGTAGTVDLPPSDATGTIPMSSTAGKVALVSSTTALTGSCPTGGAIMDFVGYGSATNCFEGTAPATTLSNTTSAQRNGGGTTDTNDNAADFTAGTPDPKGTTDQAPSVSSTLPVNAATGVGLDATVSIAFSEPVSPTGTWATIDCSTSGVHTWTAAGGPSSYVLDPTVDFAPNEGCTVTVLAAQVADADGDDPPDNMAANFAFTFQTADPLICGAASTPIHDVQGNGATSPLFDTGVTIEAVVTGDYQTAGGFGGFYLQEPDGEVDADPATSEGVFVFSTLADVSVGDVVRVRGTVTEFNSGTSQLTELSAVSALATCSTGNALPTAAHVSLPVSSLADFERYEGMLVHFDQTLTVNETFTLGRFGELRLAANGRLFTPTAIAAPGADANAQASLNDRSSFVLDDGNNQQNIDPTRYPGPGLSASNTVRSGYTVDNLDGVFDQRFSTYRLQPVGPIGFTAANPRTAAPAAVGGELRVASFNVLNFFNGNGVGGGFPTSRGANTHFEFDRQKAKEVSALQAMNADIVGLMELENDPAGNSAIEELVAGLNTAMGAGTYDFIDTGVVGTDEIRVALIYKPASVTPAGSFAVLDSSFDPDYIDTKNRPALAQSFTQDSDGEVLTVVVNHLKSKGSDCLDVADPDTGDGQGNCNITRTRAVEVELDWIATDPTGQGDPDFLLIGDMNSYAFEDPITAFTDGGFTNLVRKYGGLGAYSYVFDGEAGYLDHALGSATLTDQVTGVTDWHINADEPIALDYNVEFKSANQIDTFYDPGPYRSSDHDPVIIGLDLDTPIDNTPTVDAGGPYAVVEGGTVTVSASGSEPAAGSLTYEWDLDHDGTYETAGQSVSYSASALQAPDSRTIAVRVTGSTGLTATDEATVKVIWAFGGFKKFAETPAVNEVGPGPKLAVTFSLGGDQGLDIFAAGHPASASYACGTTTPTGVSGPAVASKPLSYDSRRGEYTFEWSIDRTWRGTCRVFSLGLADGTTHELAVHFK